MPKAKTKEVRILKAVWGKFNLPYTVGRDFKLETKLANELIREGYAMESKEAKKLDQADADEADQDSGADEDGTAGSEK